MNARNWFEWKTARRNLRRERDEIRAEAIKKGGRPFRSR